MEISKPKPAQVLACYPSGVFETDIKRIIWIKRNKEICVRLFLPLSIISVRTKHLPCEKKVRDKQQKTVLVLVS